MAGATADAFTLFERLESQLEANSGESCCIAIERCSRSNLLDGRQKCPSLTKLSNGSSPVGQLKRAAVELAKLWRLDKYLRKLDVSIIVVR